MIGWGIGKDVVLVLGFDVEWYIVMFFLKFGVVVGCFGFFEGISKCLKVVVFWVILFC